MKIVNKKIMKIIFPSINKKTEEKILYKQKLVKYILSHKTSFLKTGWTYVTTKEDDKWYWFDFDGKKIKYPKTYFVVYS